MGVFHVDIDVANAAAPTKSVKVAKLLIDCGSELTWVPETYLKQIGVTIAKKDVPFIMANGQSITRSIGYAIIKAQGFETVDEVVFGQPGDLMLLGARTLEGFGATIDPRQKKLVAAGPFPAACGSYDYAV